MSVLIKDMGKPKSCYMVIDGKTKYCPFVNTDADDDCILLLEKGIWALTWEEQYADCPLVELPEKHGRLIDAEKLKNEYPHDTDWDYPVNTNCYVCESIENAPTVIEAEG